MGNEAYHRLCNEWRYNQYNQILLDYLDSIGEKYEEFFSVLRIEVGKQARTIVKKSGVWLQDFDEVDLYIELQPFGGYNGDYSVIKQALKDHRAKRAKR